MEQAEDYMPALAGETKRGDRRAQFQAPTLRPRFPSLRHSGLPRHEALSEGLPLIIGIMEARKGQR